MVERQLDGEVPGEDKDRSRSETATKLIERAGASAREETRADSEHSMEAEQASAQAFTDRVVSGAVRDAEAREFISIGAEYKEMLLSILLMQPDDCAARRYICQKLGIAVTSETATLHLAPPSFAHSDVEVGDVASFLWGARGQSLQFVERLLNCVRGDFTQDSIYDRGQDRYSIRINLELFREEFAEASSSDLFR